VELVSRITVFGTEDMIQLGYYMAQILQGYELIFLQGELGAGKTMFAKGFGKAFHIEEEILSPTFVLLKEYQGTKLLVHYDLYRLKSMDELIHIDFFDQLGKPGIKLVEWADRFPELSHYADWIVQFENGGEHKRVVEFYACSA
jgi:tRNA threonylcarbamoyladenosine biosynthesis protein TsaE